MKYRPEINGLRALAVVPVVFFHAGFTYFEGGYLGVDIFFVISGYLITSIILTELAANKFSFRRFYERRARRILPSLFLVVASCIPFAWMWMGTSEFKAFSQSIFAVALFSSNILFWLKSGYFGGANETKPLIHTWSLAIEEQYYILVPIALMVIWKYRKDALPVFIFLTAFVSLALAEWASRYHINTNFYLLPSRGWELAAGTILAVQEMKNGRHPCAPFTLIFPLVGMIMVVGSMLLFTDTTPHPSLLTTLPIVGTMLILWFCDGEGFVMRILSSRLFVGIGLISYSLYLWHQPLFAFARLRSVNEIPFIGYVFLIALAFLLAYLSWKFIEAPFRNRQVISSKQLWNMASASTILLISFGLLGHFLDGFPSRIPKEIRLATKAEESNSLRVMTNKGIRCHNRSVSDACVIGAIGIKPTYALVGDSHAGALASSIDRELKVAGKSAVQLTMDGCLYLPGFKRITPLENISCPEWNQNLEERLKKTDLRVIIIAGRYVLQMEHKLFDNLEGGVEKGNPVGLVPVGKIARGKGEVWRRMKVAEGYRKSIENLLRLGKRVILIYPIPEVGWNVPRQSLKLYKSEENTVITTSYSVYKKRSKRVFAVLNSIPDNPNLVRIYPDKIFCNTFVPDRCATRHKDVIFYFDDDHLSIEGADLVAREIMRVSNMKWGNELVGRELRRFSVHTPLVFNPGI